MGKIASDRFAEVVVDNVDAFRKWLVLNQMQKEGVWLITYKKNVPSKFIGQENFLDLLIAFGWCDGIKRKVDDLTTMQFISPRRTKPWAKSYKDRAERLIREGKMQPSGAHCVKLAKQNGMWDVMNDVDNLLIPEDLTTSFYNSPPAKDNFDAFPPSTRRNILRWIASAKTSETRLKRINITTQDAKQNIRTKSNG